MSLEEVKQRLNQAAEHLRGELNKLRTGRAHASMLDGVTVQAYGQAMPLKSVASIVAVDATLLQITPFDPNNLDAISQAIREDSSLGLNPADDGRVVRVPVPAMTTERRQEVVKQVHEKAEQAKIAVRNVRHEALQQAKQAEKDKEMSRDDVARLERQVNDAASQTNKQIDDLADAKEAELMTV